MIKKDNNGLINLNDGYFDGYASVFGVVDDQQDRILKNAFRNTIIRCRTKGKLPMYFNHDPTVPIGYWVELEEDDYGLYVVGCLSRYMPMAASAEAMMNRISLGISVGIRIVNSKIENGVRNILEAELHEISLTRKPANSKARCFIRERNARNADSFGCANRHL